MTLQDFAYLGNPITETSSTNMTRTVIDNDGYEVATLKAEAYGYNAMIDYASILRTLVHDGKGSVGSSLSVHKDYNLQVIATIAGTQYIFVRGVSQKPLVSNTNTFKFLTNMPHLRWYEGYPFDISYLIRNMSAQSWFVRLDGALYDTNEQLASMANILKVHATSDLDRTPQNSTFMVDYIQVANTITHIDFGAYDYAGYDSSLMHPYIWKGQPGSIREQLYTDTRNPAADSTVYANQISTTSMLLVSAVHQVLHKFGLLELVNNSTVRDSIQIKRYAVPAHPFYVRWVNPLGGWDYFMFACQQKQTKTLTANDTYEPYSQYYRYGQRSTYNKAATHAIEVSTGVIDRQTLESVAECIYSPLVQMYDASASAWIEIQPKTDKQEIMADQPTGELMMTFVLPTPQLNK